VAHAPKTCTALQELHLAGSCSPALHDLCFAGHAPKACTSLQELHLAGPCSPALHSPALHNLCFDGHPLKPAQQCTIFTLQGCARKACQARDPYTHNLHSALMQPPKPVKPGIHRHAGSPLHQPVPFRHAKPMLQRLPTSPQLKVST
jgi:hypothetical protein